MYMCLQLYIYKYVYIYMYIYIYIYIDTHNQLGKDLQVAIRSCKAGLRAAPALGRCLGAPGEGRAGLEPPGCREELKPSC